MGRLLFVLFTLCLGMAACKSSGGPDQEGARATPAPGAVNAQPAPANVQPDPATGERAPFVTEGDTIVVHNRLCAVSRTVMGPEALGQFVSRVRYEGTNPRFAGKTFLFNQCCAMCLDRFPQLWAEGADEILAYHGVSAEGR